MTSSSRGLAAAELASGDIFAGHRIEALAGRGGMGVVYRAIQLALDRPVALKLVAPELAGDPTFSDRLRRESRLLAQIDHPHVVPVYEAGEAEGQLFVSMRWIDGASLGELLVRTAGLEPGRALAIIRQVASALDATHARGLVHRDVKPDNILIERRDGADHAFLSDFGIGLQIDDRVGSAAAGDRLWTLDYAAPEQLEGAPLNARADIYSLGCVLFESLTGRVPYPRDDPAAKRAAHVHEPPPSASEVCPQLPAALDPVIARAMAKDPADRYPTAGELARAAAGTPGQRVSQSPDRSVKDTAPAGRLRNDAVGRRIPRRRWLLAVVAVAVVAATIGMVISSGSSVTASCAADGSRLQGTELFYCTFPAPGDGARSGTPVLGSTGALVGYLHQGRNWVECQRPGREVRARGRAGRSWALTQSDHGSVDHGWGWVNAVYVGATPQAGSLAGVPDCASEHIAAHGQPPGGRSDRAR